MYPHTDEKMAENGGFGAVFGAPSTTLPGSPPGRFKALAPSFHDRASSFILGDTLSQAKFTVNESFQRLLTTQAPGKRHSKLVDKWIEIMREMQRKWRIMLLCAASRSECERTAY
jgi:hypothetical protein